jgi:hypothetical protein
MQSHASSEPLEFRLVPKIHLKIVICGGTPQVAMEIEDKIAVCLVTETINSKEEPAIYVLVVAIVDFAILNPIP